MGARATIAGTLVALLGGLASTAQAASAPRAVKAPAPAVVASDGAIQLTAHDDEDGELCVGLETAGGESEACRDSDGGVVVVSGGTADRLYAGIATAATVASVELRRAGQLLAAGPTVAGDAYKGKRSGKVRFALIPLPAKAPGDGLRVRALAGNGALVEVIAPNNDGELVFDRHRLLSGTYGGVRWSIDGSQSSALTPSILDLSHESVSRCATVTTRSRGSSSGSTSCVGAAPRDSLQLLGDGAVSTEDSCTPPFRLLHGIVDATVGRVAFLLGDGRRRGARMAPLGDGERLVYALAIPRDAAVRRVTFDGAGSTSKRLNIAPLAINCATGSGDGFFAFGPSIDPSGSLFDNLPLVTPTGPVTTVAGSPSFRIADGPEESLCLALGDKPFDALGCAIVPPGLDELAGTFDNFLSPRSFVIALPARVAAIRLATSANTSVRLIPTSPGPGYAGIYAGRVRFASATVGSVRELANLDLLDAQGTVLHSERGSDEDLQEEAPRFLGRKRIAGRAGHPSLWQTTRRAGKTTSRCLALTAGPKPSRDAACQTERTSSSVLLAASCVSHRLTVAVVAADGSRVKADGHAIPLRHGAGLLTLPSRRSLRSLTFTRKGKTSKVRIDAPSGARQCGYSAAPSISLRPPR